MADIISQILPPGRKHGLKLRVFVFSAALLWLAFMAGIFSWSMFSERLVKKQLAQRALAVVNTAAGEIEALGHHKIKTPSDEKRPEYRRVSAALLRIKAANPLVKYVYTARIDEKGRMRFIVDPEEDKDLDGDGIIAPHEKKQPVGALYDEPPVKYAEIISAAAGTSDVCLDFVEDAWGKWVSAAAPLRGPGGRVDAALAADISVGDIIAHKKQSLKTVLWVSLGAAAAGGILCAWLIAVFVTKPIMEMELTARRIAEGNYTRALKLTGPDELGVLVKSFNDMRRRVFNERERIARDLHDGLIQIIRAAAFQAEYIAKKPSSAAAEAPKIKRTLDSAIDETRRIILELTPAKLIEKGLIPAMRHYAAKVREGAGIECDFATDLPDNFSFPSEEELIRIYLEAVNNVKFNSRASRFGVTFLSKPPDSRTGGGLYLEIKDNGSGFDLEKSLKEPGKFGITNMYARAETNGWNLNIASGPGGTSVTLVLPPGQGA